MTIRPEVQLEALEQFRGVRYGHRQGPTISRTTLRDEFRYVALLQLPEQDVGQFFASTSSMLARKMAAFPA
jgi:hypothetical protein